MLVTDRTALICDLAETYGIFDYRALPVPLLATLASGLRDDSRIKMRMSGIKFPPNTILLAAAVDELRMLVWCKTKDGLKGRNRPKSILVSLLEQDASEKADDMVVFSSPEEFHAAWKRMDGGEINGH